MLNKQAKRKHTVLYNNILQWFGQFYKIAVHDVNCPRTPDVLAVVNNIGIPPLTNAALTPDNIWHKWELCYFRTNKTSAYLVPWNEEF